MASSQEIPSDLRGAQERSEEARSLLGHAIFGEAVQSLRRSILERLLALPAGDPRVAEVHMQAKVLDEVVGELRAMVAEIKFKRAKDRGWEK